MANVLGQISSGRVEGVTSGGASNLMVMAANQAGLSIADILAKGLDESSTNDLLLAMSNYVKGLYDDSKDNLVVQQQIAQVFGMTAADLKAVANLYDGKTLQNIYDSSSNYAESMQQLLAMNETMLTRMSTGELMNNAFANLQYSMAAGIANNPVLYGMYSMAGMLKDVVGGMSIPMVSVVGNTVDLHTNIADLMQVASLAGGIMGSLGQMLSTGGAGGITPLLLANGFGLTGQLLGPTSVQRGSGIGGKMRLTTGGGSISNSGYIGNANGDDVKQKTMDDANKDADKQLQTEKDENEEATTTDINNTLIDTLNLLKSIVNGQASFHVQVDKYGLTG